MITLEQFKSNAKERGICEMIADWDNAKSKKQLVDLCLSAKALPYVANAIAEGWGISPEVIADEFKPFLNGRYIRTSDGYTSALYCGVYDGIEITTTTALIVDCTGVVIVNRPITELYIVNSNVAIKRNILARVYSYNSVIRGECEIVEYK